MAAGADSYVLHEAIEPDKGKHLALEEEAWGSNQASSLKIYNFPRKFRVSEHHVHLQNMRID